MYHDLSQSLDHRCKLTTNVDWFTGVINWRVVRGTLFGHTPQEGRKISFESFQCFPTDARFWRDFLKRNTHLRRGKNELIFESIDIYIPFAQDDISKPRPEVSCREANIKHGTTLMPCKFRDILAIRAIIDADQRYGLNKCTRDPPFPQGIDNSRLFISFCPESAAFVLCDRKRRIGARIELDITLHMLECSVPLLTRGRK